MTKEKRHPQNKQEQQLTVAKDGPYQGKPVLSLQREDGSIVSLVFFGNLPLAHDRIDRERLAAALETYYQNGLKFHIQDPLDILSSTTEVKFYQGQDSKGRHVLSTWVEQSPEAEQYLNGPEYLRTFLLSRGQNTRH